MEKKNLGAQSATEGATAFANPAPDAASHAAPKFTPGPWRHVVGERGLYHAHERRLILRSMDDGSTATLAKLPESYGGDYYTAEANACLISAAPEMLQALKIANAAINPSGREGISLHAWNHLLREATPVICAAIAKAEGR